jgi:hypothetical protein
MELKFALIDDQQVSLKGPIEQQKVREKNEFFWKHKKVLSGNFFNKVLRHCMKA